MRHASSIPAHLQRLQRRTAWHTLPFILWGAACLAAPVMAAAQTTTPLAPATKLMDHDTPLIQALLDSYTRSVSAGDRAQFESLLLDLQIPFYGLPGQLPADFKPQLQSVQNYAGFRKAIFESGTHYTQRFTDVKIDRDGDLAQVSLNFETRLAGADSGTRGWKILHLLKVNGQWKIASEFYTAYRPKASAQ